MPLLSSSHGVVRNSMVFELISLDHYNVLWILFVKKITRGINNMDYYLQE